MFKKIVIALGVAIAAFLGLVASQPADYRIERSATIAAPASVIFAQVNHLQNWEKWSPWAKLDPNAKTTFEGAKEGVGAVMRWDGNNEVGQGSMTIAESRPNELVRFNMEFVKPMQNTATAEFSFKPEGDKTVVTWAMYGTNYFIGKAVSLLMNCDKMVGGQFEKGLASINTLVEAK